MVLNEKGEGEPKETRPSPLAIRDRRRFERRVMASFSQQRLRKFVPASGCFGALP
jgi:hypothetical protein